MTDHVATIQLLLPGYVVEGEIGRGAWGIVHAGRHRHLDRRVAIKVLPRAFGADPDAKRRFLTEARLLAALDHPHVVPVYDYAEDGGLCLLVLEHLTGGTLWQRMTTGGGVAPDAAAAVAVAMCAGLHHAHQHGVLHRDVKPENVLFATSGRPKVADFGIAKLVGDGAPQATRAGDVLGTPAYMAPEQARGAELGPATDVYAVGVVLYEMLAGRLPFAEDGDTMALLWKHVYEAPVALADVAPAVPAGLAAAVHHALAKDPGQRPASAEAFAVEIARAGVAAWGVGWLDRAGVPVEPSTGVRAAGSPSSTLPPPPPGGPTLAPRPVAVHGAPTVMAPAGTRVPEPTEERVLRLAESGSLGLAAAEVDRLRRMLTAASPAARLGLAETSGPGELRAAAAAAIGAWRHREDDPFAGGELRDACAVVIRAYEALHHALPPG